MARKHELTVNLKDLPKISFEKGNIYNLNQSTKCNFIDCNADRLVDYFIMHSQQHHMHHLEHHFQGGLIMGPEHHFDFFSC